MLTFFSLKIDLLNLNRSIQNISYKMKWNKIDYYQNIKKLESNYILILYIIHGESLLGDFQAYMGCFKVWHNLTRVLKPCTNHPELNIFWMYKSFSPFSSSDCNIYLYHWQVYLFSIKRACKSCLFFKYLVEKN